MMVNSPEPTLMSLCGWFLIGPSSTAQQRKLDELNAKLQAAERRAEQAERSAHLAESDAHHKDQELSETLSRIRLYESVSQANS